MIKELKINNYCFYYTQKGTGQPLLLIHGSLCDIRYWKKQIDFLSQYFSVYALSLRHYWPNNFNLNNGSFSIKQHSDDVVLFIEHLIKSPVHLLGHSRGGAVSLKVAINKPCMIKSLILADPGGFIIDNYPSNNRDEFRIIAAELIANNKLEEGLELFINKVSGNQTWEKMVSWFKNMVYDNADTLLGQSKEEILLFSKEKISNMFMPSLLIGGAISPDPYPKILDKLQHFLPKNERVTIHRSSHGMNIGNPKTFNEKVHSFILKKA
ncbi:putative hydrolase or acyltransferase of the alpha/beta hydrolase superfamily [Candidatus Kinetoplastibacterium desouzaii TCC079E]|uniref:Putative hydrolase or acyltransferase of the alpha/beta hydrolase superfamily n=1 Tax=Candidatus Kinetoplastidibacterium desouzai TCC079E TaxID=1208919 RepID=M1LV37_9PROT|nr:alpha/beta hydrolase [Candidatus Kinetoplastibacterium desouzaii]AGF47139.1 putative hydrolase or acyltransferase of the alpha/beta hydrolase superfamily [Candidatus Kinetoplastibacterium desouzaii TCC079E]